MLDIAQCMRDHGFDMPDPVFGDSPDDGGNDEPPGEQVITDEYLAAERECGQLPNGQEDGTAP